MTAPEIRPATDAEIATIVEMGWSCDCSTKGPNHPWMCLMVFGPRLIARIEAIRAAAQERDRKIAVLEQERDDDTALIRRLNATVAAQAEEIERLREVLGEILDVLRIHAPGTPLNNHAFDSLGVRARAALKPESPVR